MKFRAEVVRWEDAVHTPDYATADDKRVGKPYYVVSAGFAVKETARTVVLAQTVYADGTFGDFLTIPKRMISRRRRLASVEWKEGTT
jgi:hypothetical protein